MEENFKIFFSDEDSASTIAETESHMARYGRRNDIEWVYHVELDEKHVPVKSYFQGFHRWRLFGLIDEVQHMTKVFHGQYLEGTSHPILYNDSNHNIFTDEPPKRLPKNLPLQGYHLVPGYKINYLHAREVALCAMPWMFRVADLEQQKERKLKAFVTDYLYMLIDAKLHSGSFTARLTLDGAVIKSGNGMGDIDRIGEDL